MGQYYKVINLDKKQFLHPHKFDDGLKLREFGDSPGGTMFGLALLLADGNGRGGGDATPHPLIGTWAGDRIIIAGDYAGPNQWGEEGALYNACGDDPEDGPSEYEDISAAVAAVVRANAYRPRGG